MASIVKPPSHLLRRERPLHAFFAPRVVAVIGATTKPGSVGLTVMKNLVEGGFAGSVVPVNPRHSEVLGVKAYRNVGSVPETVDLAVIVTPAATVPDVVRQCVDARVSAAIVISAGFKERGEPGAQLERQVLEEARRGSLRIIGPNCLGVMCPATSLNATFAATSARPGHVAFISQSGALCTAVLDWSLRTNVGFSAFVSVGSMLDVGWGDLMDYLGDDPQTTSIVLYMESIGDARGFLSAAREVALTKPIIVIKAGRTQAAAKAAASHTGSLAGSDLVLDAAFRRSGVLRVDSIAELFYMADVLAKQPRPRGSRLTIVTNAGGPGVLATDALIANGGELAVLSPETMQALDAVLPHAWSHGNPIDILGDAGPERCAKALKVAIADSQSDGLLVVYTPQGVTNPTDAAEALKDQTQNGDKPLVASWMGGASAEAGQAVLEGANIPTFPYPDTAARIFTHMWRYTYNLRGLYETPTSASSAAGIAPSEIAASLIGRAQSEGRRLLTELESKRLLAAYGIPVVDTRLAATDDEAVAHGESIGYPVVLKLHSNTLTHKTDVGGVVLNLSDASSVRDAFRHIQVAVASKAGGEHFLGVTVQPMITIDGYELIVGSSSDPQFGPVLLFGSGGKLVEVYRDRALALPPLNTTLARRLMEQTKVFSAFQGVRGAAAIDLPALERLLVRFSELVVEQRRIQEIDINPLLVSPERMVALDARVVLHASDVKDADLPTSAIRPYPGQYESGWRLRDGTDVIIRPIRPEDEPLMVAFHANISERSVYFRYLHLMGLSERVAHERLTRACFIDYAREMALVAEQRDAAGRASILGVGRLIKIRGTRDGEFALVVVDAKQGQGLGTELLRRVVEIGRQEGLERIVATIAVENEEMQRVSRSVGFAVHYDHIERVMKAELTLSSSE